MPRSPDTGAKKTVRTGRPKDAGFTHRTLRRQRRRHSLEASLSFTQLAEWVLRRVAESGEHSKSPAERAMSAALLASAEGDRGCQAGAKEEEHPPVAGSIFCRNDCMVA